MDCVSDAGEAFVAYAGRLRWNGLPLGYTSTLTDYADAPATNRHSLRYRAPVMESAKCRWSGLGCSGVWLAEPRSSAIRRVLHEDARGRIEWECHMPRARARVTLRDGQRREGLGYVEHLTVTIPPWTVSFRELRWGRFHGLDGSTMIWIDARGQEPFGFVFADGVEEAPSAVDDRCVELRSSGGRLLLGDGKILRRGSLGATALSAWPLRLILPARALAIEETKWCGPAELVRKGSAPCRGIALHEVVRWPSG